MATPTKAKPLVSRIEQFILDKLPTTRFKKFRAWLQRNVQRYDKYLLVRHLEEKTQKLIERDDSGLAAFKAGVLKNQASYIVGQAQVDLAKDHNEPVDTLAIASKVVDELYNLNDLVGLQPLQAPVDLIYQLRYKKQVEPVAQEIKSDELPLTNSPTIERLSLEVVSQAVEAATKKLKTGYTVEVMHDLKSIYALDLASELIKAVGSEIAYELTSEVLNDLVKLGEIPLDEAPPTEVVTEAPVKKARKRAVTKVEEASDTFFKAATPVKFTDIIFEINKAASVIAHKTRRGMGNVIVCSPIVISILQSDPRLKFETDSSGKFKGPTSFKYVGTLNSTYRVYSSLLSQFDNKVLVAYKGKNGQCDAGYILSPYIPVLPLGLAIDLDSYQPMQKFGTRYGKTAVTQLEASGGVSFGLSQNYYRTIDASVFIDAYYANAVAPY